MDTISGHYTTRPDPAAGPLPEGLPIAELHCHLEGSMAPSITRHLARRHGIDLSRLPIDGDHYLWSDFKAFLKTYDAVSEVVRTAQDYYDITADYLQREAARGLIYTELFISAAHPRRFGLDYPDFVAAVASAIDDSAAAHGIHARMVLHVVRHYGVDHAVETAQLAARHPHRLVTGFGLAGDENHLSKREYQRAFHMATDAGLRLTAHAGEVAGSESVRDALRYLGVERIGHGVRAAEDPALVAELADRGIVLEVCPGSNIALGVARDYASHPIGALRASGVQVTISSDDGPFFHTHVRRDYEQTAAAHGWGTADMIALTRTAVTAAFCDDSLKAELLARTASWASENGV